MEKVLILASVASMIDQFNILNIHLLQKLGYEVHVACNFERGNTCSKERIERLKKNLKELNIKHYQIDFARNVFEIGENIKAYKQVMTVLRQNNYKFIHCHSPIGGVVGRLAAHKVKTKVIYTAHGFYFFKGAPLKNWLISYPVEKYLSRYTDVLITINKEDYNRAKKFKAKKVEYIPGVGLDTKKFENIAVSKNEKRKELGLPEDAIVLLSVGELNKNKNHETIIKAISKLDNKNLVYLICGIGPMGNHLTEMARELCLKKQVKLLGYRSDIPELLKAADIFVFPSRREGLGLAALEAMASSLPLITSNVHGIVDYSIDGITGFTCKPTDVYGFANAIQRLLDDKELRDRMGVHNKKSVVQFDLERVLTLLEEVYIKVL